MNSPSALVHSTGPGENTARMVADAAPGFMPADEAQALYQLATELPAPATVLELGTYCAKSTVYLALGVGPAGHVVTIDHHRGSEEHQPGWAYRDESLVDDSGQLDTLPTARKTLRDAGVEDRTTLLVGTSADCAQWWRQPVSAVFLDGSHTVANAHADYDRWAPWVQPGGFLLIHDVFSDPAEGGQAPFEVWQRAVTEGDFEPDRTVGSLRIVRRINPS